MGSAPGEKYDFDLITIGAGSGGTRASRYTLHQDVLSLAAPCCIRNKLRTLRSLNPLTVANNPNYSTSCAATCFHPGQNCRPPCRWSAANYGAKVAIVELPFAFVSDDKHGGAGGTCVALH